MKSLEKFFREELRDPLTDGHIETLLQRIGKELDDAERVALKQQINGHWKQTRDNERRDSVTQPHVKLERLERVRELSSKLLKALFDGADRVMPIWAELVCESGYMDRIPVPHFLELDERGQAIELQHSVEMVRVTGIIQNPKARSHPTIEAMRGVSTIEEMADARIAQLEREVGRSRAYRASTHGRLYFARRMAEIYQEAFGESVTATQGGPFEKFLREVLALCTRKKLSVQQIHKLWVRARPRHRARKRRAR